jgi:hypothetical protein
VLGVTVGSFEPRPDCASRLRCFLPTRGGGAGGSHFFFFSCKAERMHHTGMHEWLHSTSSWCMKPAGPLPSSGTLPCLASLIGTHSTGPRQKTGLGIVQLDTIREATTRAHLILLLLLPRCPRGASTGRGLPLSHILPKDVTEIRVRGVRGYQHGGKQHVSVDV